MSIMNHPFEAIDFSSNLPSTEPYTPTTLDALHFLDKHRGIDPTGDPFSTGLYERIKATVSSFQANNPQAKAPL